MPEQGSIHTTTAPIDMLHFSPLHLRFHIATSIDSVVGLKTISEYIFTQKLSGNDRADSCPTISLPQNNAGPTGQEV
jgi:hypothetical protein